MDSIFAECVDLLLGALCRAEDPVEHGFDAGPVIFESDGREFRLGLEEMVEAAFCGFRLFADLQYPDAVVARAPNEIEGRVDQSLSCHACFHILCRRKRIDRSVCCKE